MAQSLAPSAPLPPVSPEAFLADRRRFWLAFNGFTVGGIVAVILVVLLVLYCIL